jgi:hypothetical protein
MIQLQADTRQFGRALEGLRFELGQGIRETLRDEARRLAFELGSLALPNANTKKGNAGLSSRAFRAGKNRILADIKKLYRPASRLSLKQIAYLNDERSLTAAAGDILQKWRSSDKIGRGSFAAQESAPAVLKRARDYSAGKTTKEKEENLGQVLFRIMQAAVTGHPLALKNLRQVLKNGAVGDTGGAALIAVRGVGGKPYREALNAWSKGNKTRLIISEREKDSERLMKTLAEKLISRVGRVKGGWISSVSRIPKPNGSNDPKIGDWIRSKTGDGSAQEIGDPNNLSFAIELSNKIGNGGGINDRLNYVQRAIDWRTKKMENRLGFLLRKRLGREKGDASARFVYGID